MKNHFFISLAAVLALIACNKTASVETSGDTVDVHYELNASTLSKAVADGDGEAANVNRYICEVYTGGTRYMRKVNTVTAGVLQTTFDFKLVKGQTYDLLFWADCAADGGSDLYYNTASLKNVEVLTTQISCTDARDAFFGKDQIALGETQITKTVYLKRPFAQLNIITTDISDIYASEIPGSFLPDAVTLTYQGYTGFDVSTAEVTGSATTISHTCAPYASLANASGVTAWTLTMDYVLTTKATESVAISAKDVVDLNWVVKHGTNQITSMDFNSIPLKRNYRTNITGALLTNTATYTVEILPGWTGELNPSI